MPLFTKHRSVLYDQQGQSIAPNDYDQGANVEGFSNASGKPNRRPLTFTVTLDEAGAKRFTLKGLI